MSQESIDAGMGAGPVPRGVRIGEQAVPVRGGWRPGDQTRGKAGAR